MYTGTKWRERSIKSCRLNMVAFTWLQGGHQTAPQYRNRGLLSALAATKAASTSSLRQAMPSACAAVAGPGDGAAGAPFAAADWDGSGACEHAASATVRAMTSWRGRMVMVAR